MSAVASTLAWGWRPRLQAPAPRAAVAWGPAAQRLHARLMVMTAEAAAGLSATASRELLVVCGEPTALPWVKDVAYAAPCSQAPALWLPTHCEPDVPADLLATSLQRQHGRSPLLLWPTPAAVVPLDRLMPLHAALLARIQEHWQR